MRFNLKRPCKHCPFSTEPTRITFASRARAAEIEEQAYRQGFPCHQSAVLLDEEDDPLGEGGFVPGPKTQHCAGAILMYLNEGDGPWPAIGNSERLLAKLERQMDRAAPVFESPDAFLAANPPPRRRRRR